MAGSKRQNGLEGDDDVIVVDSKSGVSEATFQKSINLTSDVQNSRSASESTELDEASSSSSSSHDSADDDDYDDTDDNDEASDCETNEDPTLSGVSSGQGVGRPVRNTKTPKRFTPDETDIDPAKAPGQGTSKKTGAKLGGPKGKKTEQAKKKSRETKARLRRQITKHWQKRKELKAESKEQRTRHWEKRKEFKAEINRLKQSINEKENRIDELTSEILEREKTVQEMSGQALTLLNKHNIFSVPDDVVRSGFTKIFGECKRWAGKWAKTTKEFQPEGIVALTGWLHDEMIKKFATTKLLAALQQNTIAPKHVLNALMNRTLHMNLLLRPYGLLDDSAGVGNFEAALKWVQNMGCKSSGTDTHIWRAMTVRMLDPPDHAAEDPGDQKRERQVAAMKSRLRERIVGRAVEQCHTLLKECTEEEALEREAEPRVMLEEAQIFTSRLHAQNVWIQSRFLAGLRSVGWSQFSSKRKTVLPHRGLQLEDDDDEISTELDGSEIDLVIEPLITGRVVEQGGILGEEKTWKKAVVWIVKEGQLRNEKLQTTEPVPTIVKTEHKPGESDAIVKNMGKPIKEDQQTVDKVLGSSEPATEKPVHVDEKPATPVTSIEDARVPSKTTITDSQPEGAKERTATPHSKRTDDIDKEASRKADAATGKRKSPEKPDDATETTEPVSKKKKMLSPRATMGAVSNVGHVNTKPTHEKKDAATMEVEMGDTTRASAPKLSNE